MLLKNILLIIMAYLLSIGLTIHPVRAQDPDAEIHELSRASGMWSEEEFDQQIAQIEDAETRLAIKTLGFTYYLMLEIEKSNNLPATEVKYISYPYALNKKYKTAEIAIDSYINSLEAKYDQPSNSTFIEISPSFVMPYEHNFEWKQLDLTNGQTLEIYAEEPKTKKPGQLFAYEYANGVNLWKWGKNDDDLWGRRAENEEPLRLSGKLTATIPKDWTLNEFNADHIGQPRHIGNYVVTLTKIKANVATYKIETKINDGLEVIDRKDFKPQARDKTGRYINRRGSSSGHPSFIPAYTSAIMKLVSMAQKGKLDEAEIKEISEAEIKSFGVSKDGPLYFTYYFDGPIDSLSAVMMSPENKVTITREIDLPIQHKKWD